VTRSLDVDLYQCLIHKDQEAMEILYDRYEKLIYTFAFRLTKNHSVAEEVVQEVFFKIWNTHAAYDANKGKFSSWLLSISRNAAMDLIKKHSKNQHAEFEDRDSLIDSSQLPEEYAEENEQNSSINKAITRLKEDQQEMIQLFYFKGLSHEKIADRTGLPLGTVKSRIRLALKHLKGSLTLETIKQL